MKKASSISAERIETARKLTPVLRQLHDLAEGLEKVGLIFDDGDKFPLSEVGDLILDLLGVPKDDTADQYPSDENCYDDCFCRDHYYNVLEKLKPETFDKISSQILREVKKFYREGYSDPMKGGAE